MAKDKPKNKPKKPGPRAAGRANAAAQAAAQNQALQQYRKQIMALMAMLKSGPSPAWTRSMMQQARNLYPQPQIRGNYMTPAQLRSRSRMDVNAIMQPQIEAIRQLYDERSDDVSQAYGYYFGQFADRLGGYSDAMERTQAQGLEQQQMADEGLANFLRGHGNELAGGVAEAMKGINAPQGTLDATAGSLAGLAQGSAGETYALGGAAMDLMRAEAQNANTLMRKGPLRAEQLGREQLMAEQRLLSNQMREDITGLESRIPELAQQVFASLAEQNQGLQELRTTAQANRANALLGYLGNTQTDWFNRMTAGSAILRDLISGAQGLEQTYAGLDPSYLPPAPSGGGGGGTTKADNRAARQQILENVGKLPIFQPRPSKTPGGPPRPSIAEENPYKATMAVLSAIDYVLGNMPVAQKRRLAADIMRQLGIPFRLKKWKPKPKGTSRLTPEDKSAPGGPIWNPGAEPGSGVGQGSGGGGGGW